MKLNKIEKQIVDCIVKGGAKITDKRIICSICYGSRGRKSCCFVPLCKRLNDCSRSCNVCIVGRRTKIKALNIEKLKLAAMIGKLK